MKSVQKGRQRELHVSRIRRFRGAQEGEKLPMIPVGSANRESREAAEIVG